MTRPLLWVRAGACAAALVLAAATSAPAAARPPAVTSIGCQEVVGIFPVPRDHVELRLPAGFEFGDPFGLDPSGASVAVMVVVFECERVSWQRGARTHEVIAEGGAMVLAAVRPPQELAATDAAFHSVALSVTTGDPRHAAVLRSIGLGAGAGEVLLTRSGTGRARTPQSAVQMVTATGPEVLAAESMNRVFALRGGQVAAIVDVTATAHPETSPAPASLDVSGLPLPARLQGVGLTATGFDVTLQPVPVH